MNFQEIINELKKKGSEQNRKKYRRHGVKNEVYGVSFTNLKRIAVKIKNNNFLAEQLWNTGNHDARMLAVKIVDPKKILEVDIDSRVSDLDNYIITDAFSEVISKTMFARKKMEKWVNSENEWTASAGWNILAHLAMEDNDIPDDYFVSYMKIISEEIHNKKNRVKYSMNNALIALGIKNKKLNGHALKIGKYIGKVTVDHGDTSCKTPDAVDYINKAFERKNMK
ncbi:MAG: DNA alkylation repair protein [Acidobacteriota bacterium]